MEKTALIIGITGGFGGSVALALHNNGWRIRALSRNPEQASNNFSQFSPVEWVPGDAMAEADVLNAAKGTTLIVHGANPPGYKNWRGLAIPMLENAISAAIENRSRLVFPGNVYNFGPDAFPSINEKSPQHPLTKKGKIRVEMERMLKAAAGKGARILIVRAGDFFGPSAAGSWFSNALVKPGKMVGQVVYPGKPEVGHAWAYLPDLGRTVVELCAREKDLSAFEVFHFAGHYLENSQDMTNAIVRAAGKKEIPIKPFPWMLLTLLSPFVRLFRELLEMKYLWDEPVRLDNKKLEGFLGREPNTPLDQAVATTLMGLGCLTDESENTKGEMGGPGLLQTNN